MRHAGAAGGLGKPGRAGRGYRIALALAPKIGMGIAVGKTSSANTIARTRIASATICQRGSISGPGAAGCVAWRPGPACSFCPGQGPVCPWECGDAAGLPPSSLARALWDRACLGLSWQHYSTYWGRHAHGHGLALAHPLDDHLVGAFLGGNFRLGRSRTGTLLRLWRRGRGRRFLHPP